MLRRRMPAGPDDPGILPNLRMTDRRTDGCDAHHTSEFEDRLREYTEVARREPVTVSQHGLASVVLISAEAYHRMKCAEERATKSIAVADLPDATIETLRTADLAHLPPD